MSDCISDINYIKCNVMSIDISVFEGMLNFALRVFKSWFSNYSKKKTLSHADYYLIDKLNIVGTFRCLGPTQHLKNKFGSGYLLEVKLKAGIANESAESVDQRMDALEEYVFSMFPNAVIVERFGLRAQYKVPKADVHSLARVFTSLEEGKA